jgi:hypothetical protein
VRGGGGRRASVGFNVLKCESHWKIFNVKPWPLMARVAGAGWTQALPCKWNWDSEFSSLYFIKDARVWIWINNVASCLRGTLLACVGWAGCNVLWFEYHWKIFNVKPWPLTARVAGAAWTLAWPCKWYWNSKFSNLIFIKEAKVWFWIYDVAWNVRGGRGLQVLVGLVEMYWHVNIMNKSFKYNHGR